MMIHMLCRNRVSDFSKWKAVFDSHAEAHRDAGLRLVNLWRSIEEPTNIFFVLEVEDLDKAHEFNHSPASARAGEESGVVDGEYHFVESAPGY
jgi:hypothetical protein